MTTDATVVIVQPYIPHYRVPFFQKLHAQLQREAIVCVVLSGQPSGPQSDRRDASEGHAWSKSFHPRRFTVAGRTLDLGGSRPYWKEADAVILGLQGTLLEAYLALLVGRPRRAVGLWGHVGSYVNAPNSLDRKLETWQARSADRVFAYTPGGSRAAAEMGVSTDRVTTVMNSVDTSTLLRAYDHLSRASMNEWMASRQLIPGKTIAFVGGIDSSKRIDILVQALDILWSHDPQIKLLLAGRGEQEHLLARSIARGQTVNMGYVDDTKLAMLALAADLLAIPGRVGLIAVQALALGLPIATTEYPFHAPEYEYLTPGQSVFTSKLEAEKYAELLLELISARRRVEPNVWRFPTIEEMVSNYSSGVVELLR